MRLSAVLLLACHEPVERLHGTVMGDGGRDAAGVDDAGADAEIGDAGADAGARDASADAETGDASADAGPGEDAAVPLPLWQWSDALSLELAVASDASLAVDDQDRPIVAWLHDSDTGPTLRVARIEGERWQALAEAPLDGFQPGDRDPAVHVDQSGAVTVAWIASDQGVAVRTFDQGSWTSPFASWAGTGAVESLDVTASNGVPVIVVIEAGGAERAVNVLRYDAGQASWQAIGPTLDAARSRSARRAVVAAGNSGELALAWLEHDGHSDNLYVASAAEEPPRWSLNGAAVDLELDARVAQPALVVANDGELVVSWSEGLAMSSAAYVARWTGRFQVLGGGLDGDLDGDLDTARASSIAALALDSRGDPLALLQTSESPSSRLSVARYSGGSVPPFGIAERPPARCSIPRDDDPAFPQTLSETGCFDDVPSRKPASGLLPYSVSSPLWSDGTLKQRYLTIPDSEIIGYKERDGWSFPVGTVLVKEFLLGAEAGGPRDALPLETRFLVKRCEPGACRASWQGYSYQWNDAGTEAYLLDNEDATIFKDWTNGDRTLRHGYPGRGECMKCHATAPGGALGLQTGQLNRNHDYGQYVDNQLRALGHIGLLGAAFAELDEAAIAALPRLPVPTDPGHSSAERVRSYLHANCSHCHRPDGRWPVVDLRFEAPLISAADPNPNLCNKIVPGDASASLLFAKVSARGKLPEDIKGDPMPPLGTLVTDMRQLPVIQTWIDEMTSCP